MDIVTTGQQMINPLITVWNSFVDIIPGIIASLILLIVGYFVANLLGYVLYKLLEKAGLDKKMEHAKLTDSLGHVELSYLSGSVLKWYIFIIFLSEAVLLVNLGMLSTMLNKLLMWLPNLIIGFVIIVLGLILADFAAEELRKSKIKHVRVISEIVKVIIIFFVFVIALKQVGLYVGLAETTFLVILGSLALAFALAVGISFGFALRDEAKGLVKKIRKKVK